MSTDIPDLDNTAERQDALRKYHVLDTAPERKFDRLTSTVARICDVPTALISLVDEDLQWFKSCFGFNQRETDVEVSFCVHAMDAGRMLVVEGATEDRRCKDNPMVPGPSHTRFYAGRRLRPRRRPPRHALHYRRRTPHVRRRSRPSLRSRSTFASTLRRSVRNRADAT